MNNYGPGYTLGEILDHAIKGSDALSVITEFQRSDALSVSDSLKQQCKEDLLKKFADKATRGRAKMSEVQRLRDAGRKIDAIKLVRELSQHSYHGERIESVSLVHAKNIVERM